MVGAHRPGQLEEPIGEGRLAMVDVGDDREVADPVHAGSAVWRAATYAGAKPAQPDCVPGRNRRQICCASGMRRAVIATP